MINLAPSWEEIRPLRIAMSAILMCGSSVVFGLSSKLGQKASCVNHCVTYPLMNWMKPYYGLLLWLELIGSCSPNYWTDHVNTHILMLWLHASIDAKAGIPHFEKIKTHSCFHLIPFVDPLLEKDILPLGPTILLVVLVLTSWSMMQVTWVNIAMMANWYDIHRPIDTTSTASRKLYIYIMCSEVCTLVCEHCGYLHPQVHKFSCCKSPSNKNLDPVKKTWRI